MLLMQVEVLAKYNSVMLVISPDRQVIS